VLAIRRLPAAPAATPVRREAQGMLLRKLHPLFLAALLLQQAQAQTITDITVASAPSSMDSYMQGSKSIDAGIGGGSSTVTITGTGFLDGASVSATFGSAYTVSGTSYGSTGYSLSSSDCGTSTATEVVCTVPCVTIDASVWQSADGTPTWNCRPAGVGANQVWQLSWNGAAAVSSGSHTTSWFPAYASDNSFTRETSGAALTGWSTVGGTSYNVKWSGVENRGLKSDANNHIYATYQNTALSGLAGSLYHASCSWDDTALKVVVCTPQPGVGSDHTWKLYVGGQVAVDDMTASATAGSAAADGWTTGYGAPTITGVASAGGAPRWRPRAGRR